MAILDDISLKFGEVRRVGSNGEELADGLGQIIKHMDFVINEFENGMSSQEWVNNFTNFGGDDVLGWAGGIYHELKETREKLKLMGL